MKLTLLGTGSIVPFPNRNPSSYCIETEKQTLCLDFGPGCLQQLAKISVFPPQIDCILLSHFHLDHINDLPALFFGLRNPENQRKKELIIAGPSGLVELFDRLQHMGGKWLEPLHYTLHLKELHPQEIWEWGDLQIQAFRALHGGALECLSYQIQSKKELWKVAYSGDTDFCDEIIECCRKTDLAIVECATLDANKTEGHLSPQHCGKIMKASQCKKMVLTHFYPSLFDSKKRLKQQEIYDSFQKDAGCQPILGNDGMQWKWSDSEIGFSLLHKGLESFD